MKFDVHTYIEDFICELTGIRYPRKHIKVTVFGLVYGMGVKKLAIRLKLSYDEAAKLKLNVLKAIPGVKWLDGELKSLAKQKKPIYTWGGRRYYSEDDKWIKSKDTGEWERKKFAYKLLNLLIQGSAADVTKQAMIQVNANCDPNHFSMLVQVHDEILAEVPKSQYITQMKKMKEGMENVKLDLPMLTTGKMSSQSWARMKGVE